MTGQVALPRDLMRTMRIEPGDSVYLVEWKGRVLLVRETEVAAGLEPLFENGSTAPSP